MRVCNCGETLSASDQRKDAEIKAATRARPQVWKRAKLFIAARACDSGARRASNFWERTRPRVLFVVKFPRRMVHSAHCIYPATGEDANRSTRGACAPRP